MAIDQQRSVRPDRRRVPRGGRRTTDRTGLHPTILVADSYEGARRPCARYLDRFHFQVAEASDGEQALSTITAIAPHVIIADASLPAMPAWRLTQWLAQSWRTRNIPVIVMTSDIEVGDDVPLPEIAAGVLIKPFALTTMLAEVRRVLRAANP
jgi:DNA-binding response OmpR family regulator